MNTLIKLYTLDQVKQCVFPHKTAKAGYFLRKSKLIKLFAATAKTDHNLANTILSWQSNIDQLVKIAGQQLLQNNQIINNVINQNKGVEVTGLMLTLNNGKTIKLTNKNLEGIFK